MKTKIISALMLGLMLISLASAFGVSSPYWDGNPLTLARGETKTVNLNLQNMVAGEGDVTVKAVLVEGSDITSLPKETYVIKEGTSNDVPIKISIPKDSVPGETTPIRIEFKTVVSGDKGVAMGTGMTVAFNVIAGEAVAETSTGMIIALIIAVIVLAIIIWYLLKKKKRRK